MNNTKIKICGLRTEEDIRIVNTYRPDFAGFILAPPFKRYVPKEKAAQLRTLLDPAIRAVGVFVDQEPETAAGYAADGIIQAIQLHGGEDEQYIHTLRKILVFKGITVPIIKAFKVRNEADIVRARGSAADYVLLDNGAGTGETFDWSLIRDIGRPFLLAGGLKPENVEDAVRRFRPFAVDISSGVETDGHKDAAKVAQCID
ncbi:MAG: phosphoribosylanthranilate isomerase, partial [Eubacterium sp.]|nr:phosphoribosylanthranilate isomerase [Eubacterium sp.]